MPSLITHHIFASQVLNKLPNISLNEEIYYTFAQSHDYLFHATFTKKYKSIRALGHDAHHQNTQDYLLNIINSIKENKNIDYISYLYGSITHYCLDTICHPYIFYQTGVYYKDNIDRHKYHGLHTKIEKQIDKYLYEKTYHKSYQKCNLNKEFIKSPHISKDLESFISQIYKQTYNKDNIGYYYKISIRDTKIINTLFIHDPLSLKKPIYTLIHKISKNPIEYYLTSIPPISPSWLNEDHHSWNHPCNKEKLYNDSLFDLINKAEDTCLDIIKYINLYWQDEIDINTLKLHIPNLDYASGYLIENNRAMCYFAF